MLNGSVTTFVGFDHVNMITKEYQSFNVSKIVDLSRKLSTQYKCGIIEEFEKEI